MRAVIVNEDTSLDIIQTDKPQITQADQILVKVKYSGLCGSDIDRIFHKGAHFYPIILGHEFSGTVIEVGKNVTDLKIGDQIASVPLVPCMQCAECNYGFFSLCKNYSFVGSREAGAFADYVVIKSLNAFKLPQTVSLLEGAFFEPLTVSMHGILLAGGCKDKNIVIIGAGTIGLLALQAIKGMEAASITVIDINDTKLDLALQLGADRVYNSRNISNEEICKSLSDVRFNQLILETAGNVNTVNASIEIAGPRSTIVLIGTLHKDFVMSNKIFSYILRKELKILGSWMNYSATWPGQEWINIKDLFTQKKITLDPLIAHIGSYSSFINEISNLKGHPMNGKILLEND